MAFIENSDRIITAVLTKKGLELLYSNNQRFLISHFGLSDQEIIYGLENGVDESFTNIQNLSVIEPSTQETDFKSKLIRNSNDNQIVAINNQVNNIPPDVLQLSTRLDGSATLSLQNYVNDYIDITFSIYNPLVQSYFLSNAFFIDATAFFINYGGIYFDILPISPLANAINATTLNYWNNLDTTHLYTDVNGNDVYSLFGIDTNHKPIDGVTLQDYTNTLNIPAITFRISLPEKILKNIFAYMLSNNVSKITDFIVIGNNDTTLIPTDSYYGINPTYKSLLTKIPVTITF